MTELGYPMHQHTIFKIEKGTRPLHLSEGVAMAQILKTSLDAFDVTPVEETLSNLVSDLQEAEYAAAAGLEEWLRKRRCVGEMLRMFADAGLLAEKSDVMLGDEHLAAAFNEEDPTARVAGMLTAAEERMKRPPEVASGEAMDAWLERLKAREESLQAALREARSRRRQCP